MRILVIYCHPVETSYNAALHTEVVQQLRGAGHEVDDCDLYAEGFNPVMTREERLGYHEVPSNQLPVQGYVAPALGRGGGVLLSHLVLWHAGDAQRFF